MKVEGNEGVSDRLARRTFNVPVGPPFVLARGLGAFDKVDATGLFDRTWMELRPSGEGVDVVLRVRDAPPNRAEIGVGYSEWEKARGSIRLRNQNTLGFGEHVEALVAGSDAETLLQAELRGERLLVTGFGYRVTARTATDKPRFFDEDGEEINRARFERDSLDLAIRTSLARWGLVETGVRFGRVKSVPRGGLPIEEGIDQVGLVFGRFAFDTLDDLTWPEHGRRLAVSADWSLSDLGAERTYWRLEAAGRSGRTLAKRLVAQVDALLGFSGDDLPVYDWFRMGGVTLVPGYRHEELQGPQALTAAVSLRYRIAGQLRLVGRVGAGNVFARAEDVTLDGLRWGAGLGLYHPSPIGPASIELGVRDGGDALLTLAIGWN